MYRMCGHKKITTLVCVFLTALDLVACGQVKEDEIVNIGDLAVNRQENSAQTVEQSNSETKENETINENKTIDEGESVANQQESNRQEVEDTGLEATADELLDSFINGSINAVDPTDLASTFYITDLKMDSEDWDSYSIGEKVDLDNDGEDELVICGPYGGTYLDARDNKVYEFAAVDGNALTLSYTWYNGAIWIMYSSRSSAGFEFYHMEKFEGADNLVAEMNFGEEFDINNAEAGLKYTLNGNEISYDEYTELCSKIFAAQVNTNFNEANYDGQIK